MNNSNRGQLEPLKLPANEEEDRAFTFIKCSCHPYEEGSSWVNHYEAACHPHNEECITTARARLNEAEQLVRSHGDIDLLATSYVLPLRDQGNPIPRPIHPIEHYVHAMHLVAVMLFFTGKQLDNEDGRLFLQDSLSYFLMAMGRFPLPNLAMRTYEKVPFILLHLGRYNDLCAFVDFVFRDGEPLTEPQRVELQAGRFPFAIAEDPRRYNIFSHFNEDSLQANNHYTLPNLVALFLMKQHLKGIEQDHANNTDEFFKTDGGMWIEEVSSVLHEMAAGTDDFKEDHRLQVRRLIAHIHHRNVTILPALIHPGPLQAEIDSLGCMEVIPSFPRRPAEAMRTYEACRDFFARVPAARQVLVEAFGEHPRYYYSPFDYKPEEIRMDFDPYSIPGIPEANVATEEGNVHNLVNEAEEVGAPAA